MLQGCDRRIGTGRRDVAILTVLARLGSRRGEVAALSVDDINWHTGELAVTGKGNRRELAAGRRGRGDRRLLPRRSPQRGLPHLVREFPGTVGRFVAQRHRPGRGSRACEHAGLAVIGAHRLRHTAATGMRAAARRCSRSGRRCDTAVWRAPPSTPETTWLPCGWSPLHGPGVGDEPRAARQSRGVSAHSPRVGFPVGRPRPVAVGVHRPPREHRGIDTDRRGRAAVGHPSRRACNRSGGSNDCRWCGDSPATCTAWTPRCRCRTAICSSIGAAARRPT